MTIKPSEKGFTLIEVMIAVTILTAMCMTIYATTHRVLDSKIKVEKRDGLIHAARLGVGILALDLAQAFNANASLRGQKGTFQTGMKGNDTKVIFTTMSHYHYMHDAKDTDHVTVSYAVEKNEQGYDDLKRAESNHLLESLSKEDAAKDGYAVIENMKDFKLEYYDSNKKDWVSEWDSAGISVLGRLPMAVRITLTLVEFDPDDPREIVKEHPFSTTARVEMYKNEYNF